MNIKKIILLILLVILTSCNKATEEAATNTTTIYDPKIPGTNISTSAEIRSVFNVKICPNQLNPDCADKTTYGKAYLSWSIPNIYKSENWNVVIYKSKVGGSNSIDSLINPKLELGAGSFELIRLKALEYTDTAILQDQEYYYWIFLTINGTTFTGDLSGYWSTSARHHTKSLQESSTAFLPDAENFWKKKKFDNLIYPAANGVYDHYRIASASSSVSMPQSRVSIANNGAVVFQVDSPNNRILVLENSQMKYCDQYIDDALQYYACSLQAMSQPPYPINILGQPDNKITLSCQEHNTACQSFTSETTCLQDRGTEQDKIPSFCQWNTTQNSCEVKGAECLTNPTDITIGLDNSLFIADSGNDRIKWHKQIYYTPAGSPSVSELIGCDPNILGTVIKPTNCAANKVFGKQGFNDFNHYDTKFTGLSSLKFPTGMAILNSTLYIADTLNNRIVTVKDYSNENSYSCASDTWLTSLCQWSGVLGQPDLFSNNTFKDMMGSYSGILGGTFYNQILEGISAPLDGNGKRLWEGESENILKRYFRNPTKIKFLPTAAKTYMFVSTNEDFQITSSLGQKVSIKGRVLRFDNSPLDGAIAACNSTTFTSGACDSNEVYGQEDYNKLIIISGASGGAGSYSNTSYGLENIDDMELLGDVLVTIDGTKNSIYQWYDILNKPIAGFPYTVQIVDPAGKYLGSNLSLPDLVNITGISYDSSHGKFYCTDAANGKLYVLDFLNTGI